MSAIPALPADALKAAAPPQLAADDMAIYVLNVGDGDAMILQFAEEEGRRRFAVVDSNSRAKSLDALKALGADALSFVCCTHPHIDHLRGLKGILEKFDSRVDEYWDSGFRFTSKTFYDLVEEVSRQRIQFVRPTSGYEIFINGARLTVLSPSIALRNRYDSYGIDPNNASIVIRIEYPARQPIDDVREPGAAGQPPAGAEGTGDLMRKTRTVILGGDAQTDAWSRVLDEFPHLHKSEENWAQQIKVQTGRQPLLCDVLKVSHHASKHGINLELVERMGDSSGSGITTGPKYLINSCSADSTHGFPHAVAQEIMREVRQPVAKSGAARRPDHDLGIHYTAQAIVDANGVRTPAGSVGIILHKDASPVDVYRLCDGEDGTFLLANARKVK